MITERPPKTEKVRGMNASLTSEADTAGNALKERRPDRLHITRRQIAFAALLALVGTGAGIYTVNAMTSGSTSFAGEVTASQTYDLNFPDTGKVTQILVRVGQRVTAGQILASQDTSALAAAVAADESAVQSEEAALSQSTAPALGAAQQQQDSLQLQQAEVAVTNANNALASALASGKAAVAAAQLAVTEGQGLVNSDTSRFSQACPSGPVPPDPALVGAELQTAEAAFTHCQDLQSTLNKDLASLAADQAAVPVAEAQAQSSANSAQADLNAAEVQVSMAKNQLSLQTSAANPATQAQDEANLTQAKSQLIQAQQALQNATLVAPTSGVVAELYGAVGEYLGPDGVKQYAAPASVSAGQSASFSLFPTVPSQSGGGTANSSSQPLLEIVGGAQQVTAQVPESDVAKFGVGHRAHVDIGDLGTSLGAVVNSVVLNPNRAAGTVSYNVVLNLDHNVQGLLPGMSVTVTSD